MNDTFAIQLNHLQHVGIPVTDIRVSEAFYMRLGFSNVMDGVNFRTGRAGRHLHYDEK